MSNGNFTLGHSFFLDLVVKIDVKGFKNLKQFFFVMYINFLVFIFNGDHVMPEYWLSLNDLPAMTSCPLPKEVTAETEIPTRQPQRNVLNWPLRKKKLFKTYTFFIKNELKIK